MAKKVRLFDAIESNLYDKKLKYVVEKEKPKDEPEKETIEEQDEAAAPGEEEKPENEPKKKKKSSKDEPDPEEDQKDREEKELGDIDKDDMEDDEKPDKGETVISSNLNGKIKFLDAEEASDIFNIESILTLYKIEDPSNIDPRYGKKIEITLKSPLSDYRDYKYVVKLMEAIGEVQVFRPGFNQTFQAKAPLQTMAGAAQQQLEPGATEAPQEVEQPQGLNITGYLDELNRLFQNLVKKEFFDRILVDYA
jgi:hypothetical protein